MSGIRLYFSLNNSIVFGHTSTIKLIPHSSTNVPEEFYENIFNKMDFDYYNLKMNDVAIDSLCKFFRGPEVKFPYSKLYVDVDIYSNKEREIMSKLGHDIMYTKFYDGHTIRFCDQKKLESFNEIRIKAYEDYYKKVDETVNFELKRGTRFETNILLLNIHSYSFDVCKTILSRLKNIEECDFDNDEINDYRSYPDICIGINDEDYERSEIYLKSIITALEAKGFTYRINFPYKGSFVPSQYKNNSRVFPLTIAVNKRIYL